MGRMRILSGPTRVQYRYLWLLIVLLWPAVTFGQLFNVTPSLSVGERYDDNIFQDKRNTEDDYVTAVTPGIRLFYKPSEEMQLEFDYRPTFEFFAQNADENEITQRLLFRLAAPLSRIFSVTMRDTFRITEESTERLVEIEDELEAGTRTESRRRRERTIRNIADAAGRIQLAPRITLGLSFNSLFEDVEDVDEDDEFRYGGGASVGYLTSIARGHRVTVGYNRTAFTFSPNSPASPDSEDFLVQAISAQYRHNFTSTLVGNASFGYAVTESDDSDLDGNAGIVGGVGLTKTLNTGAASFRYDRRFTSGGGEGDLVTDDRFVVTLSTDISPKVTAGLGVNVSLVDFEKDNNDDRTFYVVRPNLVYRMLRFWILSTDYRFAFTDFDASTRADRTNHRLGFTSRFLLRQGLSLALTYRYSERAFDGASSDDDEFTRNQISLTITYRPTFRFM